jgi:hypothetical protein
MRVAGHASARLHLLFTDSLIQDFGNHIWSLIGYHAETIAERSHVEAVGGCG